MCLHAKSNKVHTATSPITVYKVLKIGKRGGLKAPYRTSISYKLKTTKKVMNANFETQLSYGESINKGIHVYKTLNGAKRGESIHKNSRYGIFSSTIPKGSKYVLGKKDQIASTQLRIDKLCFPIKK